MPTSYEITHFIAHIADPGSGQLTLSDLPTPIGAGSNFPHDFFRKYLTFPIGNANSRLATFRDRTQAVVGKAMASLAADPDPDRFVAVSRDIATHMNKVLAGRRSAGPIQISPGDLMVARFLVVNGTGDGAVPHLALMKIHPTKTVLRHAETDQGQRIVKVYESGESVPAPAEDALQKIAIVAPAPLPEPLPHDVLVLDQQIGHKDVATFFFDEFLETDLARDPDTDAAFVLDTIKSKLSQAPRMVSPPLSAGERLQVVARAESVLIEQPVVVLEDLVHKSVEVLAHRPVEARKKIEDALTDRFSKVSKTAQRLRSDQVVSVSPQKVKDLSETRTFTFDHGVTLRGPSDRLAQMMTIGRDADNRTLVTITTNRFDIG